MVKVFGMHSEQPAWLTGAMGVKIPWKQQPGTMGIELESLQLPGQYCNQWAAAPSCSENMQSTVYCMKLFVLV